MAWQYLQTLVRISIRSIINSHTTRTWTTTREEDNGKNVLLGVEKGSELTAGDDMPLLWDIEHSKFVFHTTSDDLYSQSV